MLPVDVKGRMRVTETSITMSTLLFLCQRYASHLQLLHVEPEIGDFGTDHRHGQGNPARGAHGESFMVARGRADEVATDQLHSRHTSAHPAGFYHRCGSDVERRETIVSAAIANASRILKTFFLAS